jgi:anhydro-N-acetylmuramic acid kinase
MVYKVIGLMSGSSLDGLDIAYVHLREHAGKWEYQFVHTECTPYPAPWKERLAAAPQLPALDYLLLHSDYGYWLGEKVNRFIAAHGLDFQVQLIASHGHTVFHLPSRRMTSQLGEGAALAAVTGINVVSDLRTMDLALGGQGAPIVPAGERLLFSDYSLLLNLGGIANISYHLRPWSGSPGDPADPGDPRIPGTAAVRPRIIAFDICPANRVLNLLAAKEGKPFDAEGGLAATGRVDEALLKRLNALPYYGQAYPKSLGNDFGTHTIYPMLDRAMEESGIANTVGEGAEGASPGFGTADALRTYVEHIAMQVRDAVALLQSPAPRGKLLVTGGGAHNHFLVDRLRALLEPLQVEPVTPDKELTDYKEGLVIALLGVLRWREENNVLASVTGASRDSIGGAIWMGQEI